MTCYFMKEVTSNRGSETKGILIELLLKSDITIRQVKCERLWNIYASGFEESHHYEKNINVIQLLKKMETLNQYRIAISVLLFKTH